MKSRYTLLIAASLSLALVAAVGMLSLYATNMTAKEWLETGLPAWLQGIGTLVAAVLAGLAYESWRGQEQAKRRADAAEKLLHAIFVIVRQIKDSRNVMSIDMDPPAIDDEFLELCITLVLANPKKAAFDDLGDVLLVERYQTTTKLDFGGEAEDAVSNIVRQWNDVREGYVGLRLYRSSDAVADLMYDREKKLQELALLGFHIEPGEIENKSDAFDRRLDQNMAKLRRILAKHLAYETA